MGYLTIETTNRLFVYEQIVNEGELSNCVSINKLAICQSMEKQLQKAQYFHLLTFLSAANSTHTIFDSKLISSTLFNAILQ